MSKLLPLINLFPLTYFTSDILNNTTVPKLMPPSVCETPECIHAASRILSSLDPNYKTIDPCTHFDQYACGGWDASHDLRPDQMVISNDILITEAIQPRFRQLLESSKYFESPDANNFQKLKAAYTACMDEEAVANRGAKPLDDLLGQLNEVYNTGPAFTDTDVNLTDAVIHLLQYSITPLFMPFISFDQMNTNMVSIFVTPASQIGLPAREYYNDTELLADYSEVLEIVLTDFDDSKPRHAIISDVVEFEKKLADAAPSNEVKGNLTEFYNPMSIAEVQSLIPQISFSEIIANFAPKDFKTDRLIVVSPSYIKSLSTILKETSRETMKLYFKWKMIQKYADIIEDNKIKPLQEFEKKILGKNPKSVEERWRKCVRLLNVDLGWILSRFYVMEFFPEKSKKLGDEIVSDLRKHFAFMLRQTKWMSQEARDLAVRKVENIIQKIGYPTQSPNVLDPADVEIYYADLKISNDTFFENHLAVMNFQLQKAWSQLGKPSDRNLWGLTAQTVNAYFDPSLNEIVFPAGIMQPPFFFGPDAPLYLTYGAFGAVCGHEITHAFDSTGRHYDDTGNYTNWWDTATVEGFIKREQCFVDQYSNFTIMENESTPLHVNGRLTLGENIADIGGVRVAFRSWRKHNKMSPDPHLPGLSEFSKEQLFFISFANIYCGKMTPELERMAIYNDVHAPKPVRILATLDNSAAFKKAFNCPIKKPTCKLW